MMDLDFNDSIMTFDAPSPFDILEEDEVEEDCSEESRTEWLSNFFGEEPNLPLEAVEEASRAPVMSRCGSELLSFSRQNSDAQDVLPPEQLCFLGFTDSQCDSDEGFDFCETWFQEGKASVSKSNQCNHIAPKVQEQASENFASAVLKKTQRGLHVASNPQIQQTARDGQAHWAEKVKIMRREHAMLRVAELNRAFPRQIAECCRLNLKSQKESLLLCLQRAVRDKLIQPGKFVNPADMKRSFLGWTQFTIRPGCAESFRIQIEEMFEEKEPKRNTIHSLFRRAGLVPKDWKRAWEGKASFYFRARCKRI